MSGGPLCVQTTEDAGDLTDWSGYYASHSTDQSGCTNQNNHRFGVALDNRQPHQIYCRDGSVAPGTCRGIKLRVHCFSACEFEVMLDYTTPPIVSSFGPVSLDAALAEEQHLLSLGPASVHSVASHVDDGHIVQTSVWEGECPELGCGTTWFRRDGRFEGLNHLKVTQLSGGPLCVQTTEDAGDLGDWSGYYESHSTDTVRCNNRNNHRFGVALDNWNRTTFRCRDGSATPGTCHGIKFRVLCLGECKYEVMHASITPPTNDMTVSSLRLYEDPEPELSTAALSGIAVGCVAGVGLVAGGVYAMKKKKSPEGVRRPLLV